MIEGTLTAGTNNPYSYQIIRVDDQTYQYLEKATLKITEPTTGTDVTLTAYPAGRLSFLSQFAIFYFGINGFDNIFKDIAIAATAPFTVTLLVTYYEDATSNTMTESTTFDFDLPVQQVLTDLPQQPLFAFNNQNIDFSYDKALTSFVADRAEVEVGGEIIQIFPSPSDTFTAYLKEIVSRIVNPDYFSDGLVCEIPVGALPHSTVLDANEFKDLDINITLYDGATSLAFPTIQRRFLKAAGQLSEFIKGDFNEGKDYFFLNGNYHTFFKGYPFSIGLYSKENIADLEVIDTNCKYSIDVAEGVSRLMLGQGDKDITYGSGIEEFQTFNINPTFNRSVISVKLLDGAVASFELDGVTKVLSNGDSYFDKTGGIREFNTSGAQQAKLTYNDALSFEFFDVQEHSLKKSYVIDENNYGDFFNSPIVDTSGLIVHVEVSGDYSFFIGISNVNYLLFNELRGLWLSDTALEIKFFDDPSELEGINFTINIAVWYPMEIKLIDVHTNCMPLDLPYKTYNIDHFGELIIKSEDKCGVYVKWHHNEAGWSYWLFEGYEEITSSSRRGFVEQDIEPIPYSRNDKISQGMDTARTLELYTMGVDKHQMQVLSTITDSPNVMRYWGKKGEKDDLKKWERVFIRGTSITRNRKDKMRYDVKIVVDYVDKKTLIL